MVAGEDARGPVEGEPEEALEDVGSRPHADEGTLSDVGWALYFSGLSAMVIARPDEWPLSTALALIGLSGLFAVHGRRARRLARVDAAPSPSARGAEGAADEAPLERPQAAVPSARANSSAAPAGRESELTP